MHDDGKSQRGETAPQQIIPDGQHSPFEQHSCPSGQHVGLPGFGAHGCMPAAQGTHVPFAGSVQA
jgi:hypothetical protein